ncbi:MAG: hypothetical protein ACOYMW_00970 [Candidatus Competibacteraceae bacterium]
MAITQKHRMIAVSTPLGEDVLVFGRMTATEQLGRLFEFDLELFSERHDIRPADVLGKTYALAVELLNDWEAIFQVLQHPDLPLTNNRVVPK